MVQRAESRVQQSTSLLPRHVRALRFLAAQDGDDNLSATVRKLIEREMRQRLGLNWASELEAREAA